jgi:hypothetical protein
VPDADNLNIVLGFKQLLNRLGKSANCTSRGFLNKDISACAVLECEQDKVNGSSSDIMKRVMLGSVIVMGFPAFICSIQSGTTLPREQRTLP